MVIRDDYINEIPLEFQLGYTPALDGLRGISIVAVLAFNSGSIGMQGGFVGVDIFFVLSGFLITALLIQNFRRTGEVGLKNFYIRRALRLLPALFVLMFCYCGYAVLIQPIDKVFTTFEGVLYTLFYVANWVQVPPNPHAIGALSHTWSLSVEEQFYIFWPLLLLLLLKLNNKRIVLLILLSLVAISILLNVWFWHSEVPYLRMYFGSDTRANEILIGCITALILPWCMVRQIERPRSADRLKSSFHVASLISLAGILLSFFVLRHNTAFVYNGGFTAISIGTAVLIVDMLLFPSRLSRLFELAPLVWIGKISYGLYLWHWPIFEASRQLLEAKMDPLFYEITRIGVSVLVATASYYLLEKPILRLKHRFGPDNTTGPGLIPRSQTVGGI